MQLLSIRVSDKLLEELRAEAREKDRSVSWVVRNRLGLSQPPFSEIADVDMPDSVEDPEPVSSPVRRERPVSAPGVVQGAVPVFRCPVAGCPRTALSERARCGTHGRQVVPV
jgi:hypothetical protein